MNMTLAQIAARREEIQSELNDLAAYEESLLALSDDRRLAEELHSMQCHSNHEDGCGWFWESTNKWEQGYAHKRWLVKAQNVMRALPGMSVDDILKVVQVTG